jgi:hypothetical protein
MKRDRLLAALLTLLVGSTTSLQARPAHKQALADYFGPYLPRRLNDCRTCHVADSPDSDPTAPPATKPHNPFGARLKAVKRELRKAGKPITIAARLEAVADEDSDGDGVSNLLELLSGHSPGDPNDLPTPEEIDRARQTLVEFRKFKSSYAWKPFEKVHRPAVPVVKNRDWVRNPIDAFIAAEHESHGLRPRPEAPRAVLLRRVYLDLIGLPPTLGELHAFLADPSPDAFEKVVDQLLASPQYGERWGRHWMDIWRYSDWAGWSDGGQIRDSQPHIWRWRDWIIEALNKDKGYDRMIVEMLAADELAPDDTDALRATGYLVRNYKMLSREKWLEDTVDHTAMAFLGLTLGCARCHDHMYDPILQKEYYQVRAIFQPHNVRVDRIPGQPDTKKDGLVRVFDAAPQAPTFLLLRGDDRTPDKTPLAPGVPEILGEKLPPIEPVKLPLTAATPARKAFVVRETLAASESLVRSRRALFEAGRRAGPAAVVSFLVFNPLGIAAHIVPARSALKHAGVMTGLGAEVAEAEHAALQAVLRVEQLEDAGRKGFPEWCQAAMATVQCQRQAALVQARHAFLGAKLAEKPDSKKISETTKAVAKAEAEAKQPLTTAYKPRGIPHYPALSTGRRLAFARWVANRDNPLTARVAMNHIWLRHFGEALEPSVFDFGRNGRPPSHPALLDWLAAEFMDRGWSMKAMHRLLVTSSTYRLASTSDAANVARDRDNKYLWRMPSRRVEAEVVRDCLFYVAGQLDLTMGGPEIDQNQGLTIPRRSVYFRHAAEKQMEFLKIFDCAAVTECYQRKESVLPQQALALANSEASLRQARLLARKLTATAGPDATAFTRQAFERVLSRPPTAQEKSTCLAFLRQQERRHAQTKTLTEAGAGPEGKEPARDPVQRARENLVHVLLNHNDFVTIR